MTVLKAADLKAVLDYTAVAVQVEDYAQVEPALLKGLGDLIGCDAVTLTHLDLHTQHEVCVFWPSSRPDPQALGRYPALGRSHPLRRPLLDLARSGRPPSPVRLSDVLNHRSWRRTPIYREALSGTSDQICLPLRFRGTTVRALTLSRSHGTFSDRQRDLLSGCAPHLRSTISRARHAGRMAVQIAPHFMHVPMSAAPGVATVRPPDPPAVTGARVVSPREREVLALVAQGLTDVQIARHLSLRPATVSKHLHRVYTRHHLPNRAAATRLWAELAVAE